MKAHNVGVLAIDLGTQLGISQGVFDINKSWNKETMLPLTDISHFELPTNTYLTALKSLVRERMYILAPDTKKDELVIVVPQPTFARKIIARHWKMIGVIEQLAEEHGSTTVFEVLDNNVRKEVIGSISYESRKTKYQRRMLRKQLVRLRYKEAKTDDEADSLMFLEWYLTSKS